MPTAQETFNLTQAEQLRGQISEDQQMIRGFQNSLMDLRSRVTDAQELVELTKDRPGDIGDHRRAQEKLAKVQRQVTELETRIKNAEYRIQVARTRIAGIDCGQRGDIERTSRIRTLFNRLAG
jgi:chromosome segregation ATPase